MSKISCTKTEVPISFCIMHVIVEKHADVKIRLDLSQICTYSKLKYMAATRKSL